MKPTITVAIPVYNAEMYLKDAIQSVLNQSFKDFELLILNDGSRDNSMEIAKSFNDNRIKIIDDNQNKGLIYRLNQSVNLAQGLFYARMDADDIMQKDRLSVQLKYLHNNPHVNVVGSAFYGIDESNKIKNYLVPPFNLNYCHPIFLHPSAMAKTDWFKKNPYNPSYTRMEDYELWMRTGKEGSIETISEPLMFYRMFGSPSFKKYMKSQIGLIKLYAKYKKYSVPFSKAIFEILSSTAKSIYACLIYLAFWGNMDYLNKIRKINSYEYDSKIANQMLKESINYSV